MGGGAYREHFAAHPAIYLSMRTAKGDTWEQTYGALKDMLAAEFSHHSYLFESSALPDRYEAAAIPLASGMPSESDYAGSLLYLARLLRARHGRPSSCLSTSTTRRPWPVIPPRTVVAIVRL